MAVRQAMNHLHDKQCKRVRQAGTAGDGKARLKVKMIDSSIRA